SILEIPAEKVNWHGAAYQVKSQKLTLKQALPVFREADKMTSNASITANSTSANLAETSHSSRDNGNRGRGTRGRGNSRGRGRGGIHKSRHHFRGKGRGRGQSGSSSTRGMDRNGRNHNDNNHGNNSCSFCHRPGHWVKDCPEQLKAKEQYHQSQKSSGENEYANLAGVNSHSNDEQYSFSCACANIVMETALMSISPNKSGWKIDSGATRHFSGRLEDFSGLKRWSSPRHVSTADGNTCISEGYGVCKIGYLTLKDVWYVPAFKNIKLISVGALNKDGISVIFESGTATAKKSGKIMFEASTHDNLYQILDEDLSLEPIQQRSLAAYQSGSTMRNVPIPIDEMFQYQSTKCLASQRTMRNSGTLD
ncbi:hypothetical protein K3495_g15782, partial [Podosphaera aphanis]